MTAYISKQSCSYFQTHLLEPHSKLGILHSVHTMSSWEVLCIGIVLGALAMRCAMLDHCLYWFKFNAISLETSKSKGWVYQNAEQRLGDKDDLCNAVSLKLLEDGSRHTSESTSSTDDTNVIERGKLLEETRKKQSVEVDLGVTATIVPLNEDSIELQDLDDLEGYLYGDVSPVLTKAETVEPVEPPKFPDTMWKVSYSVDAVMRPIQETFAPQLAYQAIDADLCTSKVQTDAYDDNRAIVKSILRVLGRFAIRQDNLELLKRMYEYSTCTDQDELWRYLQVVIDYKRLRCFTYMLPFVDGADAQARVLELCAYHDQVDMMKQSFNRWTRFVKSDTANAPLVVAAAQGHLDFVQFLLTKCTNVEISIESSLIDERYPNPVMAAAAGGHVAILQELVAAGAKIRQHDSDSKSPDPFDQAIATKNATMLTSLMKCNGSVLMGRLDSVDNILDFALEQNHPELMQLLLAEEAKKQGVHEPRNLLLRSASQRGQLEMMHTLITYGADVDELLPSPAKGEETMLFPWTIRERHQIIVKLLEKHCQKGCHKSIPGSSIVSRLAWLGDVKGLSMLFDEEPDIKVNVANKSGNSPLFDAMYNHMQWRNGTLESTRQQWLRTIRILLARGAKLNMTDTWYLATHHGGIPKELVSDLKEISKNTKMDRKLVIEISKG
jgi:ankyrin repeat protein